jgi:transposase
MACPHCDGTMQNLGIDSAGRRTFRCPTCGTLKYERATLGGATLEEIETPRQALALTKLRAAAAVAHELLTTYGFGLEVSEETATNIKYDLLQAIREAS